MKSVLVTNICCSFLCSFYLCVCVRACVCVCVCVLWSVWQNSCVDKSKYPLKSHFSCMSPHELTFMKISGPNTRFRCVKSFSMQKVLQLPSFFNNTTIETTYLQKVGNSTLESGLIFLCL